MTQSHPQAHAPTEGVSAAPLAHPYRLGPSGDVVASEGAMAALKKARPWALVCAIGMFVYAAVGGTMGTVWLVVAIRRAGDASFPLAKFVVMIPPNLVGAPLALVGGLLAVQYHAAAGRAFYGRNSDELARALVVQGRIWRWAAVTVAALFAMPFIILGVGVLTRAWR